MNRSARTYKQEKAILAGLPYHNLSHTGRWMSCHFPMHFCRVLPKTAEYFGNTAKGIALANAIDPVAG
jgi:hypothetical protein